MTCNEDQVLTEHDVVRYLNEHPEFFETQSELLATISVPHAHGGRAISLHERQLEVLREKNRVLERKFAELVRHAQENDTIVDRMQKWTRQLLLTAEPERLPQALTDGLKAYFAVPLVALRLWGVRPPYSGMACAAPVAVDAITLANSMKHPYCGANADFQCSSWLADGGATARSIALLPLRKGTDPNAFGMLVLGAIDPKRFDAEMGTAFLERIAELASATLSRLVA